MDDLFRFMTIRPPQSPDVQGVEIAQPSDYQAILARYRVDNVRVWFNYATQTDESAKAGLFVSSMNSLKYAPAYDALRQALNPVPAGIDRAALDNLVTTAFGKNATSLDGDPDFRSDRARVFDSIIATFIQPKNPLAGGVTLLGLARVAQMIGLVGMALPAANRVVNDTTVADAVNATIILPPNIFPVVPGQIQPVGVSDLLVVKQHLARYELGEVSTIENLLKGESRELTQKHSLTTEQTTTTETGTTTETSNELTTDERFALHREAENTVKEDTSVKGSLSVSAKYGDSLQVNANVEASYSNSKTDSTKTSSDYAKDVTMRASTKVTQTFRQTIVSRVLETLENDADRKLDNSTGPSNIAGIYQWVDKVYLAQVYNYGKRLLFDLMVPEPAALLLDAANVDAQVQAPTPPDPFNVKPNELSADPSTPDPTRPYYYGQYLAKYGVDSVDAPPLDNVTACKTFTLTNDDKTMDKGAEVPIPDGYRATKVTVGGMYNFSDNSGNGMNIWVGDQSFGLVKQVATGPLTQNLNNHEAKSIPVAIEVWNVTDYAVSVEIMCEPMDGTWEAWRLKTHAKIVDAWQKKQQDYEDAVAKLKFQSSGTSPLGSNNPDDNRKIEQRELKRSAIQLLYDPNLAFDDITETIPAAPPPPPPPQPPFQAFPRPNPVSGLKDGSIARFFEQAFEWENMMYVFYPYFWGRQKTWYSKAVNRNDDPLFEGFLNSGMARLVIPVRPTFEGVLRYYLLTGQVWGGGDMPNISDSTYLPITEEIKEIEGAPGDETPQGPPWEVRIPTSLIKLRSDGLLPGWKRKSGLPPLETQDWTWDADPPDS